VRATEVDVESLQNSVDLLQYEEYHIPPEGAPLGGPTVTKHQSLSTEESDAAEDIPLQVCRGASRHWHPGSSERVAECGCVVGHMEQDVDEEVIWMEVRAF
jgi:hypothetical protein